MLDLVESEPFEPASRPARSRQIKAHEPTIAHCDVQALVS
jgi:hypothetical protein